MGDFIGIVVFLAIFVGIPYVIDKVDTYKKNFEKKERDMKNEFEKREREIQRQIEEYDLEHQSTKGKKKKKKNV